MALEAEGFLPIWPYLQLEVAHHQDAPLSQGIPLLGHRARMAVWSLSPLSSYFSHRAQRDQAKSHKIHQDSSCEGIVLVKERPDRSRT